jgi:hypothetical protein
MSASMETSTAISKSGAELLAVDIKEGDWHAYQQHITRPPSDRDVIDCFGSISKYKRMCALAYLGRRAQHHGGVCSKAHPRILSVQFIADMTESNKKQRYIRYPWLEKLLALMAEIERIQDEISNESHNVISLVSVSK